MAPRNTPLPENIRLEMKQKARDIVRAFRDGKPNLGAEIERALLNAWKSGREPETQIVSQHASRKPDDDLIVPKAKLGRKTEAVLRRYSFWLEREEPFTQKVKWELRRIGDKVTFDDLVGDASMQACVKLGLFTPGVLTGSDGEAFDINIMIESEKTKPTFQEAFSRW